MKRVLLIVLAIFVLSIASFAQATSGVTGIVSDPTGALVPGAKVTLLDTKNSKEVTTVTDNQGSYRFANLIPGSGYKLTVAASGFQTYVLTEVHLGIGVTETHNIPLTTGQVTESVEVVSTTGDATLNTTDSSIGNIIGQRQLRELPIQIRGSPAALIGLQPGAVGSNVNAGGGNRTGSVTGARADQGNITVDGIDANDQTTGQAFNTVSNAPIDSIQEFRAVTSGPNSIDGRSSGGQIQLTTNSGTNKYHGNLREYYRTEKTSANSFFNNKNKVAIAALRRHQYGGSLGGPLPFFNFGENDGGFFKSGKDRLFFFVDVELRRDRSQNNATRTVPLQSFRNGNVGYINNNPGCTSTSRLNTTPTCISFLTPAQSAVLDPQGIGPNAALLALYNARFPLPNDLTGGDGRNTGLLRWNAPN
ncbi:MAG: carboxypeptidase regulatory-like domain-containing protein, partial [Pyrinomonadaceae bacterium]